MEEVTGGIMLGPFGTNDKVEERVKKFLTIRLCEHDCVFLAPNEEEQNKYGGKIPHGV